MGSENPWPVLHPAASARTVCLTLSFSPIFLPLSLYHSNSLGDIYAPFAIYYIASDLDAVWDMIYAATVDDRIQAKKWDIWM